MASNESAPRRPVFTSGVALAAVLVGCKAVDLLPAQKGAAPFASDLLVAVHEDLGFALASAVLAAIVLRAARARPRIERIAWIAWVTWATASVAYGVFSARVYSIIYAPLTYRVIAQGGGFMIAWSSLRVWFTAGFAALLIGVPIAYVALARAAGRIRGPSSIVVPALQILAAALVITAIMEGSHIFDWRWNSRLDKPVAESPHLALARSVRAEVAPPARAAANGPAPFVEDAATRIQDLGFDFPPEDLDDFKPTPPGPYPPLFAEPPRNVLVYVMESTGAEYVDPYGAPWGVTPKLAEIAARGLVFDSISAHIGKSEGSLVGITLSTYIPLTWRMVTEEMPDIRGTTLAQLLGPRGFRTALLSATDLQYGRQLRYLQDRGFDVVKDRSSFPCPAASSWGVSDACLVDQLLGWIDQDPRRPFFAVAWTNQTHHPYVLPKDVPLRTFSHPRLPRQIGDLDEYLNALAESDRQLGRALDGLRERGLERDTLVVITGDHGEAFGARHPTFLHGFHVYEENVHVPCIFYNPRLWPEGRRAKTVGGHVDLTPSIAQILGVPSPGSWQGRSLFDPSRPERVYSFATHRDIILSVREGPWKYILNLTSGDEELYDLAADPGEQDNAAAREPARRKRLRQHVAAWMRAQKDRYRQGEMTMRGY